MARLRSSLFFALLTAGPLLMLVLGRRWEP